MCEFWQVDSRTCVCVRVVSSLLPGTLDEVPRVVAVDLRFGQLSLDWNPA